MFMHLRVAAVLCTQKQKKHVTLTFEYDLEIEQGSKGCRGNVNAKFHQAKCSGSRPVTLTFDPDI